MDDVTPRNRKRTVRWVIVAIPIAVIGACIFSERRSYSWSQEITAEIEVDGQRYSGSSVARIAWEKRFVIDLSGGYVGRRLQNRVDAEAAVIDGPGQKPVFVLLQSVYEPGDGRARVINPNNRQYLYAELAIRSMLPRLGAYKARTESEEATQIVAHKGETQPIPEAYRPILAVFDTLSDPSTVRTVTNDAELSAALGTRARITSITLSIGDKVATTGRVRKYLPWLPATTASGGDKSSAAAAFSNAKDPVARQLLPQHFVLHVCFGSSSPCADE